MRRAWIQQADETSKVVSADALPTDDWGRILLSGYTSGSYLVAFSRMAPGPWSMHSVYSNAHWCGHPAEHDFLDGASPSLRDALTVDMRPGELTYLRAVVEYGEGATKVRVEHDLGAERKAWSRMLKLYDGTEWADEICRRIDRLPRPRRW